MTPTNPGSGSFALLHQMIDQNDEKHEAGHRRLRRDLTDGFNDVNSELEQLRASQQQDRERLIKQGSQVERRKELSMNKAVVIAAPALGPSLGVAPSGT